MNLTYGLFAFSILALWLPPIKFGKRVQIEPWLLFFVCAIISGLKSAHLTTAAVIPICALGIFSYLANRKGANHYQRIIFGILAAILALALALHLIPGFRNPILISQVRLSPDAAPLTQYANFDKASAGLILLAFFCRKFRTLSEWKQTLKQTYPIALVTVTTVIITAIFVGYVKPDFKVPSVTPIFLITNLLFTCVAEEAFFRGLLQDRLAKSLHRFSFGSLIAILCSALLFGIAHVSGGAIYVMLATLAGFGYAYAYAATQRIEASILTHFVLNVVHFIGFTYPYLQ